MVSNTKKLLIAIVLLLLSITPIILISFHKEVIIITIPPRILSKPLITIVTNPTSTSTLTVKSINMTTTMIFPNEQLIEYIRKYLEIRTDKRVYKVGETINITLINHGDKIVEIINPPWAVYKAIDGRYVEVYEPPIHQAIKTISDKMSKKVHVYVPVTVILRPGDSVSWTWDMRVYGNTLMPGKYAIKLRESNFFIKINGKVLRIVGAHINEPLACFDVISRE